ncbi:DUF3040 domain-containing protein [Saccharothrix algeriensis]|uniref:DUF3040 domain-containing protein n=2 Tax=Saccharothrix algeriensis TaxID=173560 RepID=A0ABS2S5B6_9PSEU|nr:DUF3040 domain-containing protein [Saccharothrix algeriensis]MBM7810296.1 hypothetical protein [Saccharothrix algeriensis]
MLGPHERRELADIERRFAESDPALARLLGDGPRPPGRRWASPLAVAVVGAFLIALGAVTVVFPLIFAGVLTVMSGACLRVAGGRRR